MTPKAVFRADASLEIGTGHVMRCLTLADALHAKGTECHFICREHAGNLIERIQANGHQVHPLPRCPWPPTEHAEHTSPESLAYTHWLGVTQEQDADICTPILQRLQPDWLIVDHYALDTRWESTVRSFCGRLMVIDDLADRAHDCDLLLDQTFGRAVEDYRRLVPEGCTLLCGSRYALLRPEFAQWRSYSLARRRQPELRHLLITMGGVDRDNATGQVLDALTPDCLPANCRITIVMGDNAPWLEQVRCKTKDLPWSTYVLVGVTEMARLMAESDLAIGAAGATLWERCCLGLPTAVVVLAANQRNASIQLERVQAISILGNTEGLSTSIPLFFKSKCTSKYLSEIAKNGSAITDGCGISRILMLILKQNNNYDEYSQ